MATPAATPTPTNTPTPTLTPTNTPPPVPPTATPTSTPSIDPAILSRWQSNMTKWGKAACDKLATDTPGTDQALADVFYDGERVNFQIADYTGDPTWLNCAQLAETMYKAYVTANNGGVAPWEIFPHGLYQDWIRNQDVDSQNDIILISQKAAYAYDTTPASWTVSEIRSREVAYNIDAELYAEKVGAAHRTRTDLLISQAMGHIDQWVANESTDGTVIKTTAAAVNSTTVSLSAFPTGYMVVGAWLKFISSIDGSEQIANVTSLNTTTLTVTLATPVTVNLGDTVKITPDFAPFMLGLTVEALLTANDMYPNPEIPSKILEGLEYAWQSMWYDTGFCSGNVACTNAFWYRSITGKNMAPDLNLLLAPAYSWAWKYTGDPTWGDRADKIFKGGVTQAYLANNKQFNQSYRWSFQYVYDRMH
jgi:hypothetical protein